MPSVPDSLKYFTSSQTGTLLGFLGREMEQLEATRRGSIHHGNGEYITYREDHVKVWAKQNVHASVLWFKRFDNPNPRMVRITHLNYNGSYYIMNNHEEAMLLLEMLYCPTFDPENEVTRRLYQPDSPAIIANSMQKPLTVQ